MAPLSAALANGDDTLSITVDCYSTAGTDAAITAALLAYYTSSQVDTLLGNYRTGTAQDAETPGAITAALLAYYTSSQVDAPLGDYRTASAQNTQTQAAIAGALLAYRTGPDQDVFTTNQSLEHRRRAAQLLHHRTSRRPPCRQARSHGGGLAEAVHRNNARPHETVHGAPEHVEKQPATEFRVLQDNADKFQHNKDLTDRRADERGEELQTSVRRRAAAGGRGLHDRPQHGGPRDPAEAGAAGAAGQRQRGGAADETGQAGGCEAAGRLPGASEAQDPQLASFEKKGFETLRGLGGTCRSLLISFLG